MSELIIPVDPVARAIAYLRGLFPDVKFAIDVPSNWDWDLGNTLAVVVDVGGAGPMSVVLDDVFLMVEVSNQDGIEASRVAREIYARLRHWQWVERGVAWKSSLQRPTYTPDDETKVPSYSMTVNLRFKSEIRQI